MGTNKIALGVSGILLLLVGLIYWAADSAENPIHLTNSEIVLEDTWELPGELAEISGIAFLDEDKIVGVQDEFGILYVYNLVTRRIEERIEFGPNGDYEGIALKDNTAFVLKSDGTIIVIEDYLSNPKISDISSGFTQEVEIEGLCLDPENNRLLIALKEEDPNLEDSKGIYAIDLSTKKMDPIPVLELDFTHDIFRNIDEDKIQDTFKPSEINIHPETGMIYLLEGTDPKLLILDPDGVPQELISLDERDFPQAEGITFDPSGNTYISNEGKPATIHRISLK